MGILKKSLAVCFTIFALLFVSQNGFAAPASGSGVYRDMDLAGCGPFGHAGLDVCGGKVIHMQGSGCCQDSFSSSFSTNYWGAISQGNLDAANKRVKTAKDIFGLSKKPKFHFFWYKLYPLYFRCDGMVEYIFEQAPGKGTVTDWGWFSMSPRDQWRSSLVQRSDTTTLGTSRYKNSLADDYGVVSTTAALLMLAPLWM